MPVYDHPQTTEYHAHLNQGFLQDVFLRQDSGEFRFSKEALQDKDDKIMRKNLRDLEEEQAFELIYERMAASGRRRIMESLETGQPISIDKANPLRRACNVVGWHLESLFPQKQGEDLDFEDP